MQSCLSDQIDSYVASLSQKPKVYEVPSVPSTEVEAAFVSNSSKNDHDVCIVETVLDCQCHELPDLRQKLKITQEALDDVTNQLEKASTTILSLETKVASLQKQLSRKSTVWPASLSDSHSLSFYNSRPTKESWKASEAF